jgi:integral membrane protein
MKTSIAQLRRIGYAEAISFLVLLGVAMPLKYLAGMPMAVKIVGWIHGVLFVAYCFVLRRAMSEAQWSLFRGALLFTAALLPFGPFLVDWRLDGSKEDFARAKDQG